MLPATMPAIAARSVVPYSASVRMPIDHVAVSAFAANQSPKRSRGLPCRSSGAIGSMPNGSISTSRLP
jgi:hypothetical protein